MMPKRTAYRRPSILRPSNSPTQPTALLAGGIADGRNGVREWFRAAWCVVAYAIAAVRAWRRANWIDKRPKAPSLG
jgi:hypothetical protein